MNTATRGTTDNHTVNTAHLAPANENSVPIYGNTLDEPVWTTIMRDLSNVWFKLSQVLLPRQRENSLRDWDLWGPLLLCLSLAIIMSLQAPNQQSAAVFTGVFVIVWAGAAIVTLNSKLLGGRISFFQSVCVLGYCIFPLNVAGLITLFVRFLLVRVIVVVIAIAWATYASVGFLADAHLPNRRVLALYPIYLFFFVIGWIILIS
ncbi:Yip1 domain-containing protein [Dimargaris cristalligena]|uniref:Protein YIP n=1 Tax=Dimargaris cristalligena TaxID=215637 RepID=A0A4Q0A2R2_9FUNG|nr:Yip1 domain-containing protein [Dimargaris cristalligena]|eukprot:RKP40405.1 Yip1 domain-containing protein [Dimargaris cristalligena]